LATGDSALAKKLEVYKEKLAHGVAEKSRKLQENLVRRDSHSK
jgi:hypothetical protein